MPGDFAESIQRLETYRQNGTLESVLTSARQGNPVLKELGITEERLQRLLEEPAHELQGNLGESPARLEAIVELIVRPPLLVENGKVIGKNTISQFFGADISGKIAGVEKFIPSIGRIVFDNHAKRWGGTGWIIQTKNGKSLVVTNRHVAKHVARRTFRGDAVFAFSPGNTRYGAGIDFGEDPDRTSKPELVFKIHRFTYIADDISADVALGEIDTPDGAGFTDLPLAESDGGHDETVAAIGFPAYDSRNAHVHMERYFKGLYDVKRFAPGKLVATGDTLSHDCTTLGGNSGSPLFSLDRKAVVGLHFSGEYRVVNQAVRVSTLKQLLAGTSPVFALASASQNGDEGPDGAHDAAFFAGRGGYDPGFLQVAQVPLPNLPDALEIAEPSDATEARPHELRYQHFSVLFSAANKGPAVTAFNLDGSKFKPIKRHNSTWYHDLRIPREIQLDQEDYGHAQIDRGHLVRRWATNWGETRAEAERANLDSYHYTNASPQHSGFNRSQAQWLGLEDYVLVNARTHGFRANIFTGPVYTPDDRELGNTGAPLPTHFWKVLTMLAEDVAGVLRLHATAYLLSQGHLIHDMLRTTGLVEATEGFEYGQYKTFQVRVRDLETMTGYGFGILRDHDPLEQRARAETAVAEKPVIELDLLERIVL